MHALRCTWACQVVLHGAPPPCPHPRFSHTEVTSTGVRALAHTHCDLLTTLRLDGCRVSLLTLLHMLRWQQAGLCLWDERERGHLPR